MLNSLWFHRKEQYDLNCWPIICLHWREPGHSKRLFCLYFWGVQIGKFRLNSKAIGYKHHIYRWGKGWWKP